MGSPALGAALWVSHQCWAVGRDHLLWPAGDAWPDAAQGTAAFAVRTRGWLVVSLSSPGPFLQSCLPDGWPLPVLVPGVVPPQMQDFTFSLTELLKVSVSPFFQHNILLSGGTTPLVCLKILLALHHL